MNQDRPAFVNAIFLDALQQHAAEADASADWPAESWELLRKAGVLAWSAPQDQGGAGLSGADLLAGYEQVAESCLTTAFILSQREAAVRRLVATPNVTLSSRYLPGLAQGKLFATVGLSQLTTSRQHLAPALRAVETENGFTLEGVTPWVTAADRADLIVIGATLADGRQVLLGLPSWMKGVTVEPPLPLMALAGSRTSSVRLDGIVLDREWLIAGPAERIMAGRPGGVGGLETSCLAVGLASAAVNYVAKEAEARPDLLVVAQRLDAALIGLRSRLLTLAAASPTQDDMIAIRVDCTQFALQATQVAMTVAKGAGFVAPHPVQRWARQALFFLVWSCPRPAAEGLIDHLIPCEV